MDKITPEQIAKQLFDVDMGFNPYHRTDPAHVRFADEILRLTTEAGKKK